MINYALLYGKTAFTLAKDIGVTPQAAQEFIDAYFAGFPRVRGFIDRTLEEGARDRRREDDVRPAAAGARPEQPRLSAPIGRRAGSRQHADPGHGRRHHEARHAQRPRGARRDAPEARMILTVHDELLFEVPEAEAERLAAIVRDRMQSAAALNVPLNVDVGIGRSWKEAKG